MYKEDCYHCAYLRPYKKNLCIILKEKIVQINNFCCDNFKIDLIMERMEEIIAKKDDDGSKRFWSNYLTFKPIFV